MIMCLMSLMSIHATTLDEIKSRGVVNCGVTTGLSGFSSINSQGQWVGFDVDICRAIAVAVFGDKEKVKFIPLTNQVKFNALSSKEIDVLSRVTTWDYQSDHKNGLVYVGVTYFDTQGIMVYAKNKIQSMADLNHMTICLISGTTSERNLSTYAVKHDQTFDTLTFDKGSLALKALKNGRCEALSTDKSALHVLKKSLPNPDEATILNVSLGFEPLAIMVRDDDANWFKLIRWTLFALIKGEEDGIGRYVKESNMPLRIGLEHIEPKVITMPEWALQILHQVGNYQEIFYRNLTVPFEIPRDLNALYHQGGLLYSPPWN